MKTAFRAIYWLAAAVVLLSGVAGFVDLIVYVASGSVEGMGVFAIGAVINLLTLMAGALLLPPVIDRMWAGRVFFGHDVYRAFGILLTLPGFLGLGIAVAYTVAKIPLASQLDIKGAAVASICFVALGMMFYPFSSKRIRKGGPEEALKNSLESEKIVL